MHGGYFMMTKNTVLGSTALGLAATLTACSGNAGEGTSYDEQLRCYTIMMGVNAANREGVE